MRTIRRLSGILIILSVCGVLLVAVGSAAPKNFPVKAVVSIPKNASLSSVARILSDQGIIRSMFMYKAWVVILGGQGSVEVGDYLFDNPQSALRVAHRTVNGIQGLARVKITIPEGSSTKDIARIVTKGIPAFDSTSFLSLARKHEGYLFPDTYFFYENVTPDRVIEELHNTFDAKIVSIKKESASSTIAFSDLIIMASIVEREATTSEDRKLIAGILWKRLKAGMALQVDAPFYYLLGKPSSQLTVDDLKMKSPYNTYANAGLPPAPISNPGLAAISDTLNYKNSPYWYYLAGKNGVTYYATSLEGHAENRRKYL